MDPHKNVRLTLLLDNLTATRFRALPKGAGLKTAILARELGLIEWATAGDTQGYRLTAEGLRYRLKQRRLKAVVQSVSET